MRPGYTFDFFVYRASDNSHVKNRLLASIRVVPNFLALKSFTWLLNVWKLLNGQHSMRLQVLLAFGKLRYLN